MLESSSSALKSAEALFDEDEGCVKLFRPPKRLESISPIRSDMSGRLSKRLRSFVRGRVQERSNNWINFSGGGKV